jgi:hypothetical protein
MDRATGTAQQKHVVILEVRDAPAIFMWTVLPAPAGERFQ